MSERRLERDGDGFSIDAELLGEFLDLAPSHVQELMRRNEITSICERGEGEDEGRHRLTFFHKGRRVQLDVDGSGRILRRSTIDFGDLPLPPALRAKGYR